MSFRAVQPCAGWRVRDWESPSDGCNRRRWFELRAALLRGCRVRSVRKYILNPPRRVRTSGAPSGSQEPFKALPDFLMRETLAALDGFFAAVHCFHEPALLVEI